MAPSTTQAMSSKPKRPPGIVTNGINSSTSSPSPSMSASRLPGGSAKYPPNSATSNGAGSSTSGARSANRIRREGPGHILGRGQRNGSVGVGLRSGSVAGEHFPVQHVADPPPYIKTDEYILKRYRGNPPSLVVHLHPTHFRFDGQEGSFSYKSPMRLLIEHLRLRTVPHDLIEFFSQTNVPFYEGCMIVQVVDHKTTAPAQESIRTNSSTTKAVPFSVHNNNPCLTPSPWVPYPTEIGLPGNGKSISENDADDGSRPKTSEQKDKENMPAPAFPVDISRGKSAALPKKLKTSTIVLHPTPISDHADLIVKATSSRSANLDGRADIREDGSLSATVPPTPSTAVPPTPQTSMAPPAKKLKRTRMELDINNIHAAAAQILMATTAPLSLEPVNNAAEAKALLESLAHPMHAELPPSPKTRKRTVAEMAADEAFAAAQEQYMLTFDEKNAANAQGGGNAGDGDAQAGGASFEPRFERFNTIENIRNQHEENKKGEKARQQEVERKNLQERERERLRQEAEKKLEQERMRHVQMQQAATVHKQEAQRRAMVQSQQPQQGFQGATPQGQGQHAHPQPNGVMANGIQGQPQRFHQQVSQAQASSPIVRNNTPQNHSSPVVNNSGNIPMQHSTSSMGGSPARPGSVVNQQMGGPAGHGMTAQRSQQSHAGTPRIPNATPNVQSTPLNRQMNGTPRISQASPLQGQISSTPQMPQQMMHNGVPMNLTQAQQQAIQLQQQQAMMAQRADRMRRENLQMSGGQPMNPNQQQMFQNQILRAQQQQAQAAAAQGHAAPQIAQNYQAQLAAMAQRTGSMPQNMNFNGGQNMNMQQIQQLQQMQMQQMQAQAQAQALAQNQQQQQQPQMNAQQAQNLMIQKSISTTAATLYQTNFPQLANQYPQGIPEDAMRAFRAQCQSSATQQVTANFRARRQHQQQILAAQQQQQQQQQQQGGMTPNGMNGMNMNMQRPNGM